MKNRELAYQELHDSIVNTDKFKSEGPVSPLLLRDFSGLNIERGDGAMKYIWRKDSKGKWVAQDFDPTVGLKQGEFEIAYTDANGNLVHPEDPIRVLEDLGSIYHSNWRKTDGSLDTEALDKLKKIGFTTEELGRLLVGNDTMSSKNTNTNTLAKEFPEYFNTNKSAENTSESANESAFKFGGGETSAKVATDPNIPWKNFMEGNWTYEGEECNMKGKCPSDDDKDGARRTLGSMVYMDDFGRAKKGDDTTMDVKTFVDLVNTEGTKENKLWKTAMLPMPATVAMIENRYRK
jgi:hypothetical protein